ncbi:MAG TPA: nucleotidyl transferase AbiEii/AbiGii toxin family protein, partial [Thermomicrobiales bacterium]|nr:nucleotidyl transferase AbiEii/AbiGii toxin family protein [Thermomicrobiales bacterium]
PPWLLKGGYALELRLGDTARATRDLDLGVPHPNRLAPGGEGVGAAIREALADAAERDLGDWFEFAVGPATADLDGPPGGGARYPIDCRVDGRIFAQFHVDVGLGDRVAGEPEWLEGHDFLAFAGIPPARLVVLPPAQHFAEKIHAYTFPWRDRPNTRVRDLVDLVLLLDTGALDLAATAAALRLTFAQRATHALPRALPAPPEAWAAPFAALAGEVALQERTADAAFARVAAFYAALPLDG